jgi:hypothetical protein
MAEVNIGWSRIWICHRTDWCEYCLIVLRALSVEHTESACIRLVLYVSLNHSNNFPCPLHAHTQPFTQACLLEGSVPQNSDGSCGNRSLADSRALQKTFTVRVLTNLPIHSLTCSALGIPFTLLTLPFPIRHGSPLHLRHVVFMTFHFT